MREVIGYILVGISVLCGIGVFMIASSTRNASNLSDRRSVFEREFEHHSRLAQNPAFAVLVFLGLLSGFAGMYLIGMFSR